MLMQLSFRAKISMLVAVSVVMAALLSFAGYLGISKLEQAVSEQSASATLLRSGLMADMMHDAVNADVMSALLAASKPVIDGAVRDEVFASFQSHDSVFRQQIENLNKGAYSQDELSQFNQAKTDIANYLKAADSTIKLAFQDRLLAEQQLTGFTKQFEALEGSLEKFGDSLEHKIKATESHGRASGQVAYQILLAATLAGLALLMLTSFLITRSLFKELGGDPHLIHDIAAKISAGDISVKTPVNAGDTTSVMYAMAKMKKSFVDLIDDTRLLTTTVMSGDITTRIDDSKHNGAFGELLHGVNKTLDSLIEPLNLTAVYIDKIAKGDIPPKISGIGAEATTINTIRRNLNTTIDTLNGFIAEMQHMSDEHDKGEIDVIIECSKFQGAYKAMAIGVNNMVSGHIAVKKKALACVKEFGEGNFEAPLEQFPGKKTFINETIEQVRGNLKSLIADAYWLAAEAQEGNLSARADADRHRGDFKKIIDGINHTLDSIVSPVQETIRQITQYSRGEMRGELKADFKGDFAEMKKRLNYLSGTMQGVIAACDYVKNEHDKGEIDTLVAAERFRGDFGVMATNINAVISSHIELNKKAMACVKEFGEGNFEAPLERFPGKKAFINETIEQVRSNLKALIEDTQMLSEAAQEGRIQVRADAAKHHGDFGKIVAGINATLETIVTPIITVKSAVDSISTASREISAGNADLSHRTEQQAASLEETASSMEELASTVKQNADNARQAREMSAAASEVAVKGGNAVQQVVGTMQAITESAHRIVDIISVIDGIALQTNILALNAAVEAARAGEQGRGFAVVASEVRNLAQRSAAAAKEIKELIGDSVEKVEDGSRLVDQAGRTMEEIVSSVKRVTDIMADIAAASAEQSSGINQVNNAVTQMDEVTQQNAALVEQAAAAAESLEEQAESLATTVAQFKLDEGGSAPMPGSAGSKVVLPLKPAALAKKELTPLTHNEDEWLEF